MQFRTIVSAFYWGKATNLPSLATLAQQVGVRDAQPLRENERVALGLIEPEREVLAGTWGVFRETWTVVDVIGGVICLQLYSPYVRFANAEHPGEYVAAFGDVCVRLKPTVALLDTRVHYEDKQWENQEGNRDWVLNQAKLVAAGNVKALLEERVSVLYLTELVLLHWESDPMRDDREVVELPTGRLIFARHGSARMG